ncbi:MarR family transcriptional regulator [Streptomyces sp. NPDC057418]|uniref:MarR family transcriptional regulator n=1 Tax=Streptomyces sp. NPDC057418 TaxID=3346126 RepID=UPI0036738443
MAIEHPSSALRAPASSRPYREAPRGYGKRSVPRQRPSDASDFAFLPERERYVAGYVDRLPDGAAMDIKSLAKDLPLYGQMAIGSALRALGVAGHLRQVRCRVERLGQSRWVTLTYWSRTAHDNEWWTAYLSAEDGQDDQDGQDGQDGQGAQDNQGDLGSRVRRAAPEAVTPPPWGPADAQAVPPGAPALAAEAPAPAAAPVAPLRPGARPAPASPAYLALARLGQREPRLALSAADCRVLEGLAAEWFVRGVDADYLTHALSSGLPRTVGSPVGFVRRRLVDKLPPHLPAIPGSPAPTRRLLVECTACGAPGHPEAIPDGLCRACRPALGHAAPAASAVPAGPPAGRDVHALVSSLRGLLRTPS